MSFSSNIKEELSRNETGARHCKIAEIAGFLRFGGNISLEPEHYEIQIQTETVSAAKRFYKLIKDVFDIHAKIDVGRNEFLKRSRNYTISVDKHKDCVLILKAVKLLDSKEFGLVLQNTCCKRAYIRGAFQAAGSMSDPEKNYHFEVVSTNVQTAEQLKELGIEVSIAPVDKRGFVRVDELKELIRKETVLVSVMAVNNEVGSIQPIQEISDLLDDFSKIHFHVDAVQAIGKVPFSQWLTERVDFATFSAHKFHGPRGTGFIYWKKGRRLAPLLTGGGQERKQRSGTENVPGIVAMAKALRLSLEIKEQKPEQTQRLKVALINALKTYEKVTIFSEGTDYAPHILCFALKGIRGEVLVHALEEKQIFVSTTSACSSRKHMASSTLHAMHVPNDLATSAVRISLDENNSLAEVEQFMIIFKQLYKKFSAIN